MRQLIWILALLGGAFSHKISSSDEQDSSSSANLVTWKVSLTSCITSSLHFPQGSGRHCIGNVDDEEVERALEAADPTRWARQTITNWYSCEYVEFVPVAQSESSGIDACGVGCAPLSSLAIPIVFVRYIRPAGNGSGRKDLFSTYISNGNNK